MLITPLGQRIVVRFARKPIWMPTAPSKLFRISDNTFYTPEEIEQIKVIHFAFKHQEKSIQEYMRREFYIPATQSGGIPDEFINQERIADQKIFEENEKENARIAEIKAKYFEDMIQKLSERVMNEKLEIEENIILSSAKIDEYVRTEIANQDAFVTPENIDSKIDEALENPTSYEFCIDPSGRKYGLSQELKSNKL